MGRMSTTRALGLIAVFYGLCFAFMEKPVGVRTFLDLTSPMLLDWVMGSLFAAAVLFGVLVLPGELFEPLFRPRCPRCTGRRMRPLRFDPFGDRHYRCPDCGFRSSRSLLGSWLVASEAVTLGRPHRVALGAGAEPASLADDRSAAAWPPSATELETPAIDGAIPDWPGSAQVDLLDILVDEGLIRPDHPASGTA